MKIYANTTGVLVEISKLRLQDASVKVYSLGLLVHINYHLICTAKSANTFLYTINIYFQKLPLHFASIKHVIIGKIY
jgi:hypothetical protein